MGLLGKLFNTVVNSIDWTKSATDEKLDTEYEKRRVVWIKNGKANLKSEMDIIGKEMLRRSDKKWEKDPNRSKDPNYRWTDKNRWDKD
jgi:hypothetical protein